ncbi:response regulator [Tolypothrix sp. VBCCA 56010]|uniref:response regulator n=1 Tax=Tolypothrix sp. VBCCA 56010 TaxID=3137731 RepID=UPI003D7DC660
MSKEEFTYSFKKNLQQIQELEKYIMQLPGQQAIAALKAVTASIENLEVFKEEMQTTLEVMKDVQEKLLQQNETIIAECKIYHDLFEFAPNAYLFTDAKGIVIKINNAAAALLNVLPNLLIGKSLISFVSKKDRLLFLTKLKQSLNVNSVQEWEISICPLEGQAFDAILLVKPGRETSRGLDVLQICVHDITKYKQLAASQQIPALSAPMEKPNGLDGLRVLFVDDEADSRELIAAVLMQHGVVVTTVTTVTEALLEVERSRPDVILSDIRMPDEDGYALIKKIRALEAQKGWQIPAGAITAYLAEDRAKAIKAGFQSHLHKLAEPKELIAMVAQLAGRSEK